MTDVSPSTPPVDQPSGQPSATKLDPETFRLRGSPPRPVLFRRNVIIALSGAACLALSVTTWMALKPPTFNLTSEGPAADQAEAGRPDEALADAPASYDSVPKLGPPLPGDLGRPILAHQRALTMGDTDMGRSSGDPVAEERAKREEVRVAARTSGIMMPLSGTRQSSVQMACATDWNARLLETSDQIAGTRSGSASGSAASSDQDINSHPLLEVPSPWTISAGTTLSASLVTGLNSDLPGMVVAQITENVFDSATGRTLLVPQGARLIGRYESNLRFAQRRAFVTWQRILWPDGSSIRLDDMPATDTLGQAGLTDRVDLHGGALLKGVALSTLLGTGTELGLGDEESEIVRALRESAQSSGNQAGQDMVRRNLDIQPTITVRPGWPVRVLVHRDLILRPWTK